MPISEIETIFKKYREDEGKIEHLLNSKQDDIIPSIIKSPKSNAISIEEVQACNKQTLKELETAKANLRSKAIFSPSEMQWERIYHNYNKCPSMPVTTYKCHMPVFV